MPDADERFPVDPSAPVFFLSYSWVRVPGSRRAQANAYRHVLELFDMLTADVPGLIQLAAGQQPGFLDREAITGGEDWQDEVKQAVSTCQVLVALLTPDYPTRPWCRFEWDTFASRTAFNRATGRPTRKTSILPVLWTPYGKMPPHGRQIGRFIPTGLPQEYVAHYEENGLLGLAKTYPEQFRAVAWKLAMRISEFWYTRWTAPATTTPGGTAEDATEGGAE